MEHKENKINHSHANENKQPKMQTTEAQAPVVYGVKPKGG
jgi:hypothetical protein